MKKTILPIVLLLTFLLARAQDESWKIYDDSHLSRVDITIHPDTLAWIYANVESDIEHSATFRFRNNHIDEITDSIGFRLRGNTSRVSAKKSFKVSFNTFHKGRKFYGIEKMNLNGEHNDPSVIRAKLCFDLFDDIGMKASRANHAKVYINGNYYGLYINVEHVDEEFLEKSFADGTGNLWKCLYPADLQYLGNNPQTYRDLNSNGRPVYELKTNKKANDFSQLARLIRIINTTASASLPDSLEAIADVGNILTYFAMSVLTGSWDDYRALMNNYYLYLPPSTGRFLMIPYDYDNTFGIDWFGVDWAQADPYNWPRAVSGNRPLADRMLQNAQYRDLFTHFLQFYSDKVFALHHWDERLTATKNLITPAAQDDWYRTLDYGFTMDDFNTSYTSGNYQNQHVKNGIRQFVNLRNSSLATQLESLNAPPMVYELTYEPRYPLPGDSVHITAACYGAAGLANAIIQYRVGNSTQIIEIPMAFRPDTTQPHAGKADRWTGVIPPLGAGAKIRFKVSVTDNLAQSKQYPRHKWEEVKTVDNNAEGIKINEFMASNATTIADPAGEYDDWVELYNPTDSPKLLSGCFLSDKPDKPTKWKFPENVIIEPFGYLIVWCDEDPQQPGLHSNFKLSADGESILLTAADGNTRLDEITFGPQETDISFGRFPDATGPWQKMHPTPLASNRLLGIRLENETPFEAWLFPNPARQQTSVHFASDLSQPASLMITDLSGRALGDIIQIPAGSSSAEICLKNYRAGIYLIRVQTVRGAQTLRVVKTI